MLQINLSISRKGPWSKSVKMTDEIDKTKQNKITIIAITNLPGWRKISWVD